MKLSMNEATMKLHDGQLLKLKRARGSRLICGEGLVWVTQEGMTRDVFLAPARAFEVTTNGVVLIEAMTDAILTLAPGKVVAGATRLELSPA